MVDDHKRNTQDGRRSFLGGALVGLVGGPLVALSQESAQAAPGQKSEARLKGLHPKGAPAADVGYTPGISAEGQRLVFVSGQGPEDLTADMETQMRQTFERIGLVLEAAGASYKDIVILRSYFVHLLRDLPVYRKVRKDYLVKPYPASTAVGTPELAIPGLEIEIEAVAIV